MHYEGAAPAVDRYYSLIKQCKTLAAGRHVQSLIAADGFGNNLFLASHLIRMFTIFGSLCDAQEVFGKLSARSAFAWSAIISAHAQLGHASQALDLYKGMLQQPDVTPNEYVFLSSLKACAKTADFLHGKLILMHAIECGLESKNSVMNTTIDVFIKCGSLEDARGLFLSTSRQDVVTWNVLIAGYVHNKNLEEAANLFEQMRKGGIEPDHVTWNALIGGYGQHGESAMALLLFEKMKMQGYNPSQATYVNIVQACASVKSLDHCKMVHVQILESGMSPDLFVGSSLIDAYVKLGGLEIARSIFENLSGKDMVTWNAMISGYVQSGYGHLAFRMFLEILDVGKQPDNFTFVSAVKACTLSAARVKGKEINHYIVEGGLETDLCIASALIDMHCKWHSLEDGHRVFNMMPKHDMGTWNALISGYAQYGHFKEVFGLFELLKRKGFTPDTVTFTCILSACSHAGLVDEAYHHLEAMKTAHIKPGLDHFDCMLDMLGRLGHLNEALQFQKTIPFVVQDMSWRSLLSHCKTHGNVDLGKKCFNSITTLDEKDSASYVLMSNLCSDVGMWEDAVSLEEQRKASGLQKKTGMAFIEIDGNIHHFLVGEIGSPYPKIQRIRGQLMETGYMPLLDSVLCLSTPVQDHG